MAFIQGLSDTEALPDSRSCGPAAENVSTTVTLATPHFFTIVKPRWNIVIIHYIMKTVH